LWRPRLWVYQYRWQNIRNKCRLALHSTIKWICLVLDIGNRHKWHSNPHTISFLALWHLPFPSRHFIPPFLPSFRPSYLPTLLQSSSFQSLFLFARTLLLLFSDFDNK
jgi:hypothetical protein